jgi:hypothetical protein
MKNKVIYKKIYCDRFFVTAYLFVGNAKDCHKKAVRVVPEYKDREDESRIGGRYGCQIHWTSDKTSEYIFVLWFREKPDIDTLIHEVNHLVRAIFECIGVPTSDDTEEIESYLEGWWARQIQDAVGVSLKPMNPPPISQLK